MLPIEKHVKFLVLFSIILAFAVITLGAYVRLSDAGLGCPDWPGCYGKLFGIPQSAIEITEAESVFSERKVDVLKAWKEMAHRYIAGILGIIIFYITYLCIRRKINSIITLAKLTSLLVIAQVILGMLTVTLKLQPTIVIMHLLGGFTIICMLWLIYLRLLEKKFLDHYSKNIFKYNNINFLRHIAFIAITILIIQIMLGGWTSANYAALACPDFPTCQNSYWPEMNLKSAFSINFDGKINYEYGVLDNPARVGIHYIHRLWAIITTIAIFLLSILCFIYIKSKEQRIIACCLLVFLFLQILLGILNVKLSLPIYVAVAHNGNAVLLLMTIIAQIYYLSKIYKINEKKDGIS